MPTTQAGHRGSARATTGTELSAVTNFPLQDACFWCPACSAGPITPIYTAFIDEYETFRRYRTDLEKVCGAKSRIPLFRHKPQGLLLPAAMREAIRYSGQANVYSEVVRNICLEFVEVEGRSVGKQLDNGLGRTVSFAAKSESQNRPRYAVT